MFSLFFLVLFFSSKLSFFFLSFSFCWHMYSSCKTTVFFSEDSFTFTGTIVTSARKKKKKNATLLSRTKARRNVNYNREQSKECDCSSACANESFFFFHNNKRRCYEGRMYWMVCARLTEVLDKSPCARSQERRKALQHVSFVTIIHCSPN